MGLYHQFLAENVDKGTICELEIDEDKAKQFKDAIENNYWFEFFMGMLCILFFICYLVSGIVTFEES